MTAVEVFPGEYRGRAEELRLQCARLTQSVKTARAAITATKIPPRDFTQRHYATNDPPWEPEQLSAACSQLLNDVDGCAARVGGPLSIAVLGAFNSGKSTTLNELCALMMGVSSEALPETVRRPTDINPCTQTVCVLQHPTSPPPTVRGRAIDFVAVEHDSFRQINLVDTPGSQDTPELDEVSREYLAYIDVFLFLNSANRFADQKDRELYKYVEKNYIPSQVIFVITFADTFFFDGASNAPNESKIRSAIDNANLRIAKDLPAGTRFRLAYGKNVFLVEQKTGYGYRALYEHIIGTFGSEAAGREKLRRLEEQVDDLSRRTAACHPTGGFAANSDKKVVPGTLRSLSAYDRPQISPREDRHGFPDSPADSPSHP